MLEKEKKTVATTWLLLLMGQPLISRDFNVFLNGCYKPKKGAN